MPRPGHYIWKKAPFLRVLPPLSAGILLGYHFDLPRMAMAIAAIVTLVMMLIYELLKDRFKFSLRYLPGLLFHMLILFAGTALLQSHNIKNQPLWYGYHLRDATHLKLTLLDRPASKARTIRYMAEVEAVMAGAKVLPAKGTVLLYMARDLRSEALTAGRAIIVQNQLKPIRNAGNPGEFNFEKFMADQNTYFQAYLSAGQWQLLPEDPRNAAQKAIHAALSYSDGVLAKYIRGSDEVALANALLTGNRDALDEGLVEAYVNSGVVHIMAISGLHVGLIYLFLFQLCRLIPLLNQHPVIQMILVIAGIWFFALMTGASPSVLRAAVMFSFFAASKLMRRKTTVYNFWAAAAVCLLCFNPYLLFHIGFQLSFMAVLGILVVQRPIYHCFEFDNKFIDYNWQLISVTLSAQLVTLPLCLYYFHQFPLLFIFANLVAIPLASCGLWSGVLLLVAGWLPVAARLAGTVTEFFFYLMNQYIRYINRLEFAVWKGFLPGVAESILLSAVIALLSVWLLGRRTAGLKLAMACLAGILCIGAIRAIDTKSQRKLVVYNLPNETSIDLFIGARHQPLIPMPDTSSAKRSHDTRTTARQFLRAARQGRLMNRLEVNGNEFFTGPRVLYHVRKPYISTAPAAARIKLDAIILSSSPRISIHELHEVFDADLYIFSTHNKRYLVENWKKECEELLLRAYDVASEGALVMNF